MKLTLKALLIFALAVAVFSACGSDESTEIIPNAGTTTSAQTEIKQITVEQAKTAVEKSGVQFIDVRTKEEFAGGHAPARSIIRLMNSKKIQPNWTKKLRFI